MGSPRWHGGQEMGGPKSVPTLGSEAPQALRKKPAEPYPTAFLPLKELVLLEPSLWGLPLQVAC